MQITLVSRIFPPEPAAASERLGALVRALDDAGDDVTVVTTTSRVSSRDGGMPRDVRVRRWPVLRDRNGYVRGYLPYLSFDLPAALRLLVHRGLGLVVVEPPPTTGAVVRVVTSLRRRPYAYYAADIWSRASASAGAPGIVLRMLRRLERFAMDGAAVCLCVSPGVEEQVRALAPRARTVVVGHGVDTSTFSVDVSPHPESTAAVYVGTASEWHGAEILVEALVRAHERGHDIPTTFVGQGAAWQTMAERVAHAGLADFVRFVPSCPPDEAARWLRGARVALSSLRPGVGYDFAVPTKTYSALASGTPVLYCGPGPTRDLIVQHGLGRVAQTVDELADALIAATASDPSPAERRRLSDWAGRNISATAVAARASSAVHDAAAGR